METGRAYRVRCRVLTGRIIIPSAHVNALGLVMSLRESGWGGAITCVKRKPKQRALTQRYPDWCETVFIPLDSPSDLQTV